MEEVPNNIEVLKTEISVWFDSRKAKILEAVANGMRERDLEDVLAVLKSIDSEHNEFDDYIPNSTVRKMMGVDESK